MHKHKRDKGNKDNPQRFNLLNQWRKYKDTDGLNSLVYKVCCFFDRNFIKFLSKMFYICLQNHTLKVNFYNNL